MGYKTLELTLISARDLKNVNLIGKMDVYVVVSLSGDPRTKQKTPVHQDGGSSPYWNHTLRFTVDEDTAGWSVVFQLKHEHTFGRDKDVGEVRVPVKDLLSNKDSQIATYQVRRPSGKTKGELKFSYKATDAVLQPKAVPPQASSSSSSAAYPYPPQSAYPAPPQTAYPPQSAYPPPPQTAYPPQSAYPPPPQTAYPAPPATGYPYGGYLAPQQQPGYGYGYPQQITQKPKRNGGLGMGLGAGLIGGALGGLLIEDMVSDSYDAGYDDAGYDDADFDMGF